MFIRPNQDSSEIEEAGVKNFKVIYKGSHSESLNDLRHAIYMRIIASSNTEVRPEVLPPTESAARCHCCRVYIQVQTWKNLREVMDPTEWGYTCKYDQFIPIMSKLPLAPTDLLKVVRCSCKTSNCTTRTCSCRKAGIPCVSACMHSLSREQLFESAGCYS